MQAKMVCNRWSDGRGGKESRHGPAVPVSMALSEALRLDSNGFQCENWVIIAACFTLIYSRLRRLS
jgi:hypothetical protein